MSGSELFWTTYFMLSGMIVNVALVMALALFLVLWLVGKVEDAQRRRKLYAELKQSLLDEIESR